MGPNKLFKWLRENKVLMKGNVPYQQFIDKGYFRLSERVYHDKNREPVTYTRTLVTGPGLIWLCSRLGKTPPLSLEICG